MNPNYRTLHNDIGMIQRTNNGWDLWFDNGDLVKAEDFHSLQVGIIIACLTSWNYMNRYGNPTYNVFGNKAYQLLKANKSSMVQYKIQQFFLECLKRMRRVYDVVSLTVSEVPYDPYKYYVEFEVISINNQLVDGSFIVTTDASKSTSYIDYNIYMPYASNESDLEIDLWLKNEYGGGLEGEILYMYLQKGDGEYEFYDVVGRTDETGYLRVTYTPTENNENNIIYFDFHGNSTYNPSTSKRTVFKTELYEYIIEFEEDDLVTPTHYQDLHLKLSKQSLLDGSIYVMNNTVVTVRGSDGEMYTVTTDLNGEANLRVRITENTLFTAYYGNASSVASVSVVQQVPVMSIESSNDEVYGDETIMLTASLVDELGEPIEGIEIGFSDEGDVIGSSMTDANGVATITLSDFSVGTHVFTATSIASDFYASATGNISVVVHNLINPQIELSSNKAILSYADSETATLTATYNLGGGATMELYNGDTGAKIGNFTDNGGGNYTYAYASTGGGDINLVAKVGANESESVLIEDCLFYGINTDAFTIPSNTTFTSDGEKITITTSTNSEKSIYFDHTFNQSDDFLYEVEVAQLGTRQNVALLWNNSTFWGGQDVNGNSALAVFNNDSGSVAHTFAVGDKFKIVKENGTSSAYINDNVFKTSSATYNSTFKIGFYSNLGRTQHIKNIKIKLISTS